MLVVKKKISQSFLVLVFLCNCIPLREKRKTRHQGFQNLKVCNITAGLVLICTFRAVLAWLCESQLQMAIYTDHISVMFE